MKKGYQILKKILVNTVTTMVVLMGVICFGNVQKASAKVLNSIPKSMRGTWYDKYGGKSIFKARSLTEVDHFNHKTSVTHWRLATHSLAIRKWVNGKPQYYRITKNEQINSYSNGRIAIWWQADNSNTGTMHPSYYQLSHKVVNGHRYQKLIESVGAGFGINPDNNYRVKKLPKIHKNINSYRQAEKRVLQLKGHYIHGYYYQWTAMSANNSYLFHHKGHLVYWIRGINEPYLKHKKFGSYSGYDYYVYLNGKVIKRVG